MVKEVDYSTIAHVIEVRAPKELRSEEGVCRFPLVLSHLLTCIAVSLEWSELGTAQAHQELRGSSWKDLVSECI